MNCNAVNAFFDNVWPVIAASALVWALMETLKERWSVAANLRTIAGLFFVGTLLILGGAAFLGSGVQSPCRDDSNKVERIHRGLGQ